MQNNSKFYKLLKEAVTSDVALVKVLDQIMKIINYNSKDSNGNIDENLKSELWC